MGSLGTSYRQGEEKAGSERRENGLERGCRGTIIIIGDELELIREGENLILTPETVRR